jgi:hypothetical protein
MRGIWILDLEFVIGLDRGEGSDWREGERNVWFNEMERRGMRGVIVRIVGG